MKRSPNKVHPGFKLNGISYTSEELKEVGYSLIKEGEEYEIAIGDFLLDWLSEAATVEVRTSGSTGVPKRIQLQKQQMQNSAEATATFFGLKEGTKALNCLPSGYISGKMMLARALTIGWELDCIPPSSTPLKFTSGSYDFCAMVPLQAQNSLESLQRVKTLIVGGAPISESLKMQLQNKPTAVYETYGMTETVSHIALKRIENVPNKESHFRVLEGVKVSQDKRGCLLIDAPQLTYEQVVTNDVVELFSDSEFSWLGRYDNIVNSGGIKLIPEQIEKAISGVVENRFFTIGLPDAELGQRLVLVVEGKVDKSGLISELKELKSLHKHQIPKSIEVLSRFVETPTGKVNRQKTAELIQS